jgi:16S rRNA (cytosine1402-N4)-methyltransferase
MIMPSSFFPLNHEIQETSSQTTAHIPVLYQSTLDSASVQEHQTWIDCTLGRGGHSRGLLEAGAHVIGFDKDHQALDETQQRLLSYGDRFKACYGDFRDLKAHLHQMQITTVDGILADIGVSSPQLDLAHRGFSFSQSGPVDMRMDQDQSLDAWTLISESSASELSRLIYQYGEEPFARPIAQAIKRWAD